ncbi:MAG: 16S rRNA (cytosine(1402)-N(4))-methyltransferase RsmH [Bacteroidaceae bacterium]|nr:16S rRNA (cytosine(1402)-N(4))-methyltransferase RsmH [Bacteroidaceae bacterium]
MTNPDCYHIPVMLNECLDGLNIKPDGIYLDLTYGGGGHSKEIVKRLSPNGHLYGFDQDMDAMAGAMTDERFTFVRSNFRFIKNWMQYYGVEKVDGILADLGVSSHHLDEASRGFSFRYDAPLDMRMNQKGKLSAKEIIAEYSEEQLADILYLYGELKQSRRIASAIVKARSKGDIQTTGQLAETIGPLLGYDREKKDLARVFQALRIEVNGEMKVLKQMLDNATDILAPKGRLVIMTYHSLEDRIVKNHIKGNNKAKDTTNVQEMIFGKADTVLKSINKGVITATAEELNSNPRSRSAKLRIAEKS